MGRQKTGCETSGQKGTNVFFVKVCLARPFAGNGTAHLAKMAAPHQPHVGVYRCFKTDKFLTNNIISPYWFIMEKHIPKNLGILTGIYFSKWVGRAHLQKCFQSHFGASLTWSDNDSFKTQVQPRTETETDARQGRSFEEACFLGTDRCYRTTGQRADEMLSTLKYVLRNWNAFPHSEVNGFT